MSYGYPNQPPPEPSQDYPNPFADQGQRAVNQAPYPYQQDAPFAQPPQQPYNQNAFAPAVQQPYRQNTNTFTQPPQHAKYASDATTDSRGTMRTPSPTPSEEASLAQKGFFDWKKYTSFKKEYMSA